MHRNKSNPLPEHSSAKELADQFCAFFKNKVDKIRDNFDDDITSAVEYDGNATITSPLSKFELVSDTEIQQILEKSANKSCNLDPVPTTILKQCSSIITPVLSRIVNLSLQTSSMPEMYKRALVTPLLKKPNLDTILSNYRPVSNLPFVSKIIEECVIRQITRHMIRNGLGEVLQSAYKPGHSTETALVKVLNDICTGLNDNKVVFMAMLDLSAAFDTVDHRILLRRLEVMFGIHNAALDWFGSYFADRSMQVIIEGETSDPNGLVCSVPQGSKLGPRLYSDYTLPLGMLLRFLVIIYHFYADDSQLLRISSFKESDQRDAVNHLERSIHVVAEWMFKNKLKLNPTKTEFITISSARNAEKVIPSTLKLDDGIIERSQHVRNLGVTMDSHLDMQTHVSTTRRLCYFYIGWIKQIRPFLCESDAKMLVHALVISRLDYCNSVYYGLPKHLTNSLQLVMNDAARVIKGTGRNRDISITNILKELHWLPIVERSKFKILMLVFKCLENTAPQYLSDLLCIRPEPARHLRGFDNRQLCIPRSKNKYGERSFLVSAPTLWNSLPFAIRNSSSLDSFKRSLKTFLFKQYYNC